jgi:hypothetical protein
MAISTTTSAAPIAKAPQPTVETKDHKTAFSEILKKHSRTLHKAGGEHMTLVEKEANRGISRSDAIDAHHAVKDKELALTDRRLDQVAKLGKTYKLSPGELNHLFRAFDHTTQKILDERGQNMADDSDAQRIGRREQRTENRRLENLEAKYLGHAGANGGVGLDRIADIGDFLGKPEPSFNDPDSPPRIL